MATRTDFEALIDWCTQPHPTDHPRLKRVVHASLTKYDGEGNVESQWEGVIRYAAARTRFFSGDFSGGLVSLYNSSHVAVTFIALGDDNVWAGIQGPYVPPELAEDASLDLFANDGAGLIGAILPSPHTYLLLWPTYQYGG